MKTSLVLFFLCMIAIAHAEEIYPPGCQPLVVKGDLIRIPKGDKRIVMIHNLSSTDLWITHPQSKPNASAGWSSRLRASNWSALALNKKSFALSCIESRPGHEQQTPCVHVVGTCQWSALKQPAKPTGIFWAGEDMALSPLIAYIHRRGFVVPSSVQ